MSKSARQRKLELLKAVAAKDKLVQKLAQEKQLNLIQAKMMENELNAMKQQLEALEKQRSLLITKKETLESQADPETLAELEILTKLEQDEPI